MHLNDLLEIWRQCPELWHDAELVSTTTTSHTPLLLVITTTPTTGAGARQQG